MLRALLCLDCPVFLCFFFFYVCTFLFSGFRGFHFRWISTCAPRFVCRWRFHVFRVYVFYAFTFPFCPNSAEFHFVWISTVSPWFALRGLSHFCRFFVCFVILLLGLRGFPFCVDFDGYPTVCLARGFPSLPFFRFLRFYVFPFPGFCEFRRFRADVSLGLPRADCPIFAVFTFSTILSFTFSLCPRVSFLCEF